MTTGPSGPAYTPAPWAAAAAGTGTAQADLRSFARLLSARMQKAGV